jgi:hypothetical protein
LETKGAIKTKEALPNANQAAQPSPITTKGSNGGSQAEGKVRNDYANYWWRPQEVRDIQVLPDRFLFACPQCGGESEVMRNEVNCGVFRHGSVRGHPGMQLPPHASQAECEALLLPWSGCGKPFRFNGHIATPCGYDT